MRRLCLALALTLAVGLGACVTETVTFTSVATPSLTVDLSSPAFEDGGPIPVQYTCDGADLSPPLAWESVPDGVLAFALIVEDPDAGGFIHWVLSDIPGDLRELPEDQGDAIGAPGATSFGRPGWGGPCPPSGEHHYVFTLYALSAPLGLDSSATATQVRTAADRVLVASGQLTGVYARGG
jgi:Raf kinase inhibitor-like YbhB/YbcL family protein